MSPSFEVPKLYISGQGTYVMFICVIELQGQFLDFAYCYPTCSRMVLIIQACWIFNLLDCITSMLLKIMYIFFYPCPKKNLGISQSKMLCKSLATLLSVLSCSKSIDALRCGLCLFNVHCIATKP